ARGSMLDPLRRPRRSLRPPPASCAALRSRLLEFDERAAEILRMQEQHRLAMRADLRLAVAEHARALGFELVARGDDVLDLIAEMMNAARRILLDEARDRGLVAIGFEELDLRVRQLDEDDLDPVLRDDLRLRDLRAERAGVSLHSFFEIRDGDGDVIETSDHFFWGSVTCCWANI